MGRPSPAQPQTREERGWKRRRVRRRRLAPLVDVLSCLEREFPESLGDLVCVRDLAGTELVDSLVELTGRLLRERDPRARLLAETLVEAYPYRPIAHCLWGRALALSGAYARASAVLRNVLVQWPDFPGRAAVQTQLDSLP